MTLAQVLCDELIVEGFWADYIDPCSGLPVRNVRSLVKPFSNFCNSSNMITDNNHR